MTINIYKVYTIINHIKSKLIKVNKIYLHTVKIQEEYVH